MPINRGPMTGVRCVSSFSDPELRVRLAELVKACGHVLDEAKIVRRHTSMLALVNQHELRTRGIGGEASLQQVVADHAEGIRGEEPDVVVLGHLIPARCDLVKAGRQDEPTQDDDPRTVDHEA